MIESLNRRRLTHDKRLAGFTNLRCIDINIADVVCVRQVLSAQVFLCIRPAAGHAERNNVVTKSPAISLNLHSCLIEEPSATIT